MGKTSRVVVVAFSTLYSLPGWLWYLSRNGEDHQGDCGSYQEMMKATGVVVVAIRTLRKPLGWLW